MTEQATPRELGYYFPAEFAKHEATWLSWPHKEASWPGKLDAIYPAYCQFVKEVSKGERVHINVNDKEMKDFATDWLNKLSVDLSQVSFYIHPTNDAWCRDHGPAFLINPFAKEKKVIVDWNYNAWGNKYPPYDLDDIIPTRIAKSYRIPAFHPGIVMEGGSVEFNGNGTVLTSRACLLNPNRNPHLSQGQIENYLINFYGVDQVLWISDGILGDDTDGHIDDTVRFVTSDTILAVTEVDRKDGNYPILRANLRELKKMRLTNGKQLNIVELPMPSPVTYDGQRLPASYANFYIANAAVIVPTFQCEQDQKALETIQCCFPTRKVLGIDSTDIIWGLGSFHCLSQQEPAVLENTANRSQV